MVVAEQDIESQIQTAMQSRVNHFKEQSDSLTFESVRRLLEKDLCLETYTLDVHKRFIKQFLLKCLADAAADENASKNSGDTGENTSTIGETGQSPEGQQIKEEVKENVSHDEEKMDNSPVMGLLTGNKPVKSEPDETAVNKTSEVPSENIIKKAIRNRAAYIKKNLENYSLAGVRRLLEEDLELNRHTLDSCKKFISDHLDEVINSGGVEPETEVKKKNMKLNSQFKASKKVDSRKHADSSGNENDEVEEDEVRPKKKVIQKSKVPNKERSENSTSKIVSTEQNSDSSRSMSEEVDEIRSKKTSFQKGMMQKSESSAKRKRPAKMTNAPSKKRIKTTKPKSKDNSDVEDSGDTSEDEQSLSSSEKTVKKKEVSAPAYGKHVEHLKSVIKLCGMSVPPSVYKKVKQVPENKRETALVKELEAILSKEGLSADPSEKEIKQIRKKKERAKELEGIDMSNIVLSSRRRSTISFVAPPKPKVLVESDEDDSEQTDEDEDDGEGNEDGDVGNEDSQSEELNDDNDDSE